MHQLENSISRCYKFGPLKPFKTVTIGILQEICIDFFKRQDFEVSIFRTTSFWYTFSIFWTHPEERCYKPQVV